MNINELVGYYTAIILNPPFPVNTGGVNEKRQLSNVYISLFEKKH